MSRNSISKIDSLTKLQIEKNRLSVYCSYQEKLIGLKIGYFRDNYSMILGNSLLPYEKSQNVRVNNLLDAINDVIAGLLPEIFKGKFLPRVLLKFVQILMVHIFTKKK